MRRDTLFAVSGLPKNGLRWAGGLFGLVAAGCATNVAEQQACPVALVVQPASEVTQFLPGPGRDLTDVVLEAKLSGVDGFCEFDLEQDGSGDVAVEMQVVFEAARGPANETRSGEFTYFVALVDKDKNVLRKPLFDAALEFPANASRIRFADDITVDFQLQQGEPAVDYEIWVGFQLTEDEVEYNQSLAR